MGQRPNLGRKIQKDLSVQVKSTQSLKAKRKLINEEMGAGDWSGLGGEC